MTERMSFKDYKSIFWTGLGAGLIVVVIILGFNLLYYGPYYDTLYYEVVEWSGNQTEFSFSLEGDGGEDVRVYMVVKLDKLINDEFYLITKPIYGRADPLPHNIQPPHGIFQRFLPETPLPKQRIRRFFLDSPPRTE